MQEGRSKDEGNEVNAHKPQRQSIDKFNANPASLTSLHLQRASLKTRSLHIPESNQSEVVSKEIINKVISLVFTEVHREEVNNRITDFCCEYVKESIRPCLYQQFMAYDQCAEEDLAQPTSDHSLPPVFLNNHFIDNNTWKEIKEPPKSFIERDASTLMPHMKATEDEEQKYDSKRNNPLIEVTPVLSDLSIRDEKKLGKKLSQFKLTSKQRSESERELKGLKTDLKPVALTVPSRDNKKLITRVRRGQTEDEEDQLQKEYNNDGVDKNKVIELESHDLPIKVFSNSTATEEQLREYEEMRKERVREIARREEEERHRKEQEKKEHLNSLAVKHVKEIDTQRLTFDPNGKIIPLRLPKIESLGNEFYWSKQAVKELAVFPNEIPKEKPASSPQKKDQKGKIRADDIGSKRKSLISTKNVKEMKELPTSKDQEVAYNVDNTELMLRKRYSRYSAMKNNTPITPAGSNMNIISPEVGVIISDGLQKKEGSMEFSAKFNKPSMEEFSQIALDSINFTYSKKQLLNSSNSNRLDESNQYIGYAEKFQSANNPLIQNAQSRNSVHIKGDIATNRLLTSDNPLLANSKMKLFHSQNFEGIVLGKQLQTNLKTAIDLVEDASPYQNMISAEFNKLKTEVPIEESDFIKERPRKTLLFNSAKEPLDLNMVNAFNSNIIKSKDWGSSNLYSGNRPYHRLPVKSNHVREMGLRIVSTKLPRDRRLNSGNRINSIR